MCAGGSSEMPCTYKRTGSKAVGTRPKVGARWSQLVRLWEHLQKVDMTRGWRRSISYYIYIYITYIYIYNIYILNIYTYIYIYIIYIINNSILEDKKTAESTDQYLGNNLRIKNGDWHSKWRLNQKIRHDDTWFRLVYRLYRGSSAGHLSLHSILGYHWAILALSHLISGDFWGTWYTRLILTKTMRSNGGLTWKLWCICSMTATEWQPDLRDTRGMIWFITSYPQGTA